MARLFSTREDKAIIEFVRNSDKSWRGNALYRDLAKQMPSRSWQSVKSRFVKTLFVRLSAAEQEELQSREYMGSPTKRPRSSSSASLPDAKRRRHNEAADDEDEIEDVDHDEEEIEDDEAHDDQENEVPDDGADKHRHDDTDDLNEEQHAGHDHEDDDDDDGPFDEEALFGGHRGGYLGDAARWIEWLSEKTGRPRSVVTHALVAHNGKVERALRYLLNPDIYCRISAAAEQPWTPEEDAVLHGDSEEDITALASRRGKASVQERAMFLDNKSLF